MSRIVSKTSTVVVPKKGFDELSVKLFEAKVKGKIVKGFVLKKNGRFFVYQNLCKHLPVTLDLGDGGLFTHDKAHFQCHMHGAMYELETGYCVAGPCQGARLNQFDLVEEEARLVIRVTEEAFNEG